MKVALALHILAGSVGIVAGFVALYSTKGAALHRRAGMVFVAVMLAMTCSGLLLSLVRGAAPAVNIPASLLTAYLVFTGLTTVRPLPRAPRWILPGATAVALGVGLVSLAFGFEAIANGGSRKGMPAFPFFMFGVVGVWAGVLDVRMARAGEMRGPARLARHLWRMCFALFIAALSFFLGQADVIPKPIRIPPLLAAPVLAVLVTMFYWLWRVRGRRDGRMDRTAAEPIAAPAPHGRRYDR